VGKLQDMQKKEYAFFFEEYDSASELNGEDSILLTAARQATEKAYAPYSQFRVGAAARLSNGEFVSGANQENAAFPAGLCAEGVLLATASSLYPGVAIDTLAVSYRNERGSSDRPISPCGICRQSLQEFEQRTGRPVRLIMGGMEGKVYIVPQASLLLPLAFGPDELG
jgi:cytidine deaminase